MQYLISLISNRAILFDIFDIKECHKNLTVGRLPTILFYIEYLWERRRARASAHWVGNQKEELIRKKEGGKGASLRSSDAKNNSRITSKRK